MNKTPGRAQRRSETYSLKLAHWPSEGLHNAYGLEYSWLVAQGELSGIWKWDDFSCFGQTELLWNSYFPPRVTLKHVTYPIADYTEPLLRPTSTDITSFFSVRRSANYNYTFQQMSEKCRQKMFFFKLLFELIFWDISWYFVFSLGKFQNISYIYNFFLNICCGFSVDGKLANKKTAIT